jgi:phosphatidylserine decarboxylase
MPAMRLPVNKSLDSIWDRAYDQMIVNKIYGKGILEFLHATIIGRILMHFLFSSRISNEIITLYNYTIASTGGIRKFITKYDLDTDELEKPVAEYKTFADFFIRRLKSGARQINTSPNSVVAPCDSLIHALALNLGTDTSFNIKGATFKLADLIQDYQQAEKYIGGTMIIFYLAPYNNHHFIYPVSGDLQSIRRVGRKFFSVNSISLVNGFRPFDFNRRDLCIINTAMMGEVMMVEVGGFYAGKIIQENAVPGLKEKGDTKGYFALGGSTVVLVFEKGKIDFDKDIIDMQTKGVTTSVKQGEKIGEFVNQNLQ